MTSWVATSGNLEAVERVDVLAKVPGQIDALHAEEGQRVADDEPLLELDPNEYRLAGDRAEAEMLKKEADLARSDRMHEQGVISKQDYGQAQYDLRHAQLSRSTFAFSSRRPIGLAHHSASGAADARGSGARGSG